MKKETGDNGIKKKPKCRNCGYDWPHPEKKNRARQEARNANIVDCSIILVNCAEIPMPDHLQSKSTRDKSMTKRAQVMSLHGQSVHRNRMIGHPPT
jgi:hypothetical protein